MVPHFITALTGPINELEQRIIDSTPAIERWFRLEWMEHTPPFYASIDLRNSGFKLAPVDTNLFPSGWNNLTEPMLPLAVQATMASIEKICPEARNLLIIPENHNRSPSYLASLAQLQRIFKMSGLNVRLGSISPDVKKPVEINLPTGQSVVLEPVVRTKRRLGVKHFDPCTILLNNDLSAGVPGILEELYEQYLLPPLHASWSMRRKSRHFQSYEEVAKRFGKMLGIDHWLITPLFSSCEAVDVQSAQSMEQLRNHVEALLGRIRRKYKEYGIQEKPFVEIKADNSASGTQIMAVESAADLDDLANRNPAAYERLQAAANGPRATDLLLQEGVQTSERMHDAAVEPVVYMMDRYVVGGAYRVPTEVATVDDRNNAQYVPLTFDQSSQLPEPGVKPGASGPNRFYMYGVLARLAMLAASYELEAADPEAEHAGR